MVTYTVGSTVGHGVEVGFGKGVVVELEVDNCGGGLGVKGT
ncbi:MAG: hypothetical protein Kow0088_04280 [Anaerolineales bacterium]